MTALTDALALPHFHCIADFSAIARDGVIAAGKDLRLNFDDACDDLMEFDRDGQEARVFRIEFAAGKVCDVTEDARAAITRWRYQRGIAAE